MKYFVPPGGNTPVPILEEDVNAKAKSGGKSETLSESLHGESGSSGEFPESESEGGGSPLDVPAEDDSEETEEDVEDEEDEDD